MSKESIRIVVASVIAVFLISIVAYVGLRGESNSLPNGKGEGQEVKEVAVAVETEMVRVNHPRVDEVVESPYVFDGEARGNWFFEADFPVRVLDADGTELGVGIAEARNDWMTEEFVPFIGTVMFENDHEQQGTMVFEKDNPSGLPEYADSISVPVWLKASEVTRFQVYFGNTVEDPQVMDCEKVYPVDRVVPKTQRVALEAIDDLLYGPSEEEQASGYVSQIPSDPRVIPQSVEIRDRTVYVDFNDALDLQVGGSCRVLMIRAQIEETLKQFPTVDDVVISINGRSEDILQP